MKYKINVKWLKKYKKQEEIAENRKNRSIPRKIGT